MANQWGRDSQVSTRSRERSVFFPVLLSFAFGAAITFGALLYLQVGGVPKEQMLEATAKIDELEQRLSSLNNQLSEADNANQSRQSLERKISELNDENARIRATVVRITKDNENLKNNIITGTDDPALQNLINDKELEIQQLRNRNQELESNKIALGMADKKIAELKEENAKLALDLSRVNNEEKSVSELLTSLKTLNSQYTELQHRVQIQTNQIEIQQNRIWELENVKAALGMADKKIAELKAENERLKTDLSSKDGAAANVDEYAAQLQKLELENRELSADIETLKKSAAEAAASSDEKLNGLSSGLSDKLLTISNLTAEINKVKAANASEVVSLKDQIAKLERQLKNTETALTEANSKLEEAQKAQKVEPEPETEAEQPITPSKKGRDVSQVNESVDTATGAGNLTSGQKEDLKSQLVKGECVGDSLKTALGRVPVLMLRDLIRDLNSDC